MTIWKAFPLCALFLVGCGSDSEPNGIWSDDSQRLQVERFNGYTRYTEEMYTYFDFAKDDLDAEALQHLFSLSTTEDNLRCDNDARTYDVIITDGSGIETQYYSSNRQCGRENDGKFISLDDLNALNSLLE